MRINFVKNVRLFKKNNTSLTLEINPVSRGTLTNLWNGHRKHLALKQKFVDRTMSYVGI